MDWFARDFIKSSLVWLGLGVTFGICMAVDPALTIYAPAHVHMNLLGFVTMMIYGVAYHVLPRFTGHPLWSRRLPAWHWFASNAGLLLMVCGFGLRVHPGVWVSAGTITLATGGVASSFGAYVFIVNMWRTIDGNRTVDSDRQPRDTRVSSTVLRRRPAVGSVVAATPP